MSHAIISDLNLYSGPIPSSQNAPSLTNLGKSPSPAEQAEKAKTNEISKTYYFALFALFVFALAGWLN
jgi:hypothetical protein